MLKSLIPALAVAMLGTSIWLYAADSKPCCGTTTVAADTQPATKPATQPADKPVNTKCPVMTDDDIDPKLTLKYKGKTIAFCCDSCIPEFKKNPEKYMKNLK